MESEISFGTYSISYNGDVRNTVTGKKLKPTTIKGGYKQVKLYNNTEKKCFLVHRLVAIAFHPNPDNLPEVGHIDNDTSNNHGDNLKWTSSSDNVQHSYNTGRISLKADKHPRAIFDRTQILTIRSLEKDLKVSEISKYFGCDSSTIRNIIRRKSYSSI